MDALHRVHIVLLNRSALQNADIIRVFDRAYLCPDNSALGYMYCAKDILVLVWLSAIKSNLGATKCTEGTFFVYILLQGAHVLTVHWQAGGRAVLYSIWRPARRQWTDSPLSPPPYQASTTPMHGMNPIRTRNLKKIRVGNLSEKI